MPFPNIKGLEPAFTDKEACEKIIGYWDEKIETGLEKVPTAEGLANFMGITSKTIQKYKSDENNFKQFGVSYRILLDSQVVKLINGGLGNEMNSNIVKLMLFNHGYSDKIQTDNTNKNIEIEEDETKPPEERLQDILQRIKALKE